MNTVNKSGSRKLVTLIMLGCAAVISAAVIWVVWARHEKQAKYQKAVSQLVRVALMGGSMTRADAEILYNRPEGKLTISPARLQKIIQEFQSRAGEHHSASWAQRCAIEESSLTDTKLTEIQKQMLADAYVPLLKIWPKDPHHDLLQLTMMSISDTKLFQCKPILISYSHSPDKLVAKVAKDSLKWLYAKPKNHN